MSMTFGLYIISIHALREEGDALPPGVLAPPFAFLSTPSARRATHGRDAQPARSKDFYPRPPRGGRLTATPANAGAKVISIHALREEGDLLGVGDQTDVIHISIHALREEGDSSSRRW